MPSSMPFPKNYFILLFPCVQHLDWSGPVDILSMVPKTPHPNNNITVTLIAESLDPINLAPVPPHGATWKFETPPELQVTSDSNSGTDTIIGAGINVMTVPQVTFTQALTQLKQKGTVSVDDRELTLDVLLIPGGIGTRMTRIEKNGSRTSNVAGAVEFVKAVCELGFLTTAVLTVCTGADLFARTGLLDGRRATTNALAFEKVVARHKDVKWLKGRRWVRSKPESDENGNQNRGLSKEVWTSAGVSAGMDLMLHFLREVYGDEFASGVARKIEYEWRKDVGDGEVDPYYA